MTLQTIGERERAAAEKRFYIEPTDACEWQCPLMTCNSQRSSLYRDATQATAEFEAHLKTHSIEQAIDFIKESSAWLTTFDLAKRG